VGYDGKRLIKLGLTAFLENVGMYKIPESVLTKKGKLEEKEISVIKSHPIISYRILAGAGEKYQWLAKLALQTHERSDGSGYPKGLKGEEISEVASIIGLTETYIAMIKRTPYRDPYSKTDAVKFVIEDAKRQFPIKVLKAFFNEISLYPVNTYVRLNSGAIGRVRATNKRRPLRPRITLLYDSEEKKLPSPRIIDLSEDPLFYIVENIDEKDLP
jgi:HD-GYP domain-containing protein (c-di-GMP phosphodiesterase class II)